MALGVSVGMFFGFVPLIGLKTLLAMGTARVMRGNIIAAAIAVTLHDVVLPLAPLLLRWEYQIGYWLLSHPHQFPPSLKMGHYSPSVWLHWNSFFTIGFPLLLGSVVVALPAAVLSYTLTLRWFEKRQKRMREKAEVEG
jgi:uncharacterized protein (DUF2062 family)